MAAVKQTLATFMASFFGKSEKAISEKLSTDEHNQFTSEALELQEKVTNLENERDTLQSKVTTLEGEKTTLESTKATLESDKTTLQNSLTEAEGDRDKYKAWFERQKGVGAKLPEGDASDQGGGQMSDYNAGALEVFRKAKGQ